MDTRQKQLAAWCSLVLSFCRLHKQSSMTVMEAQESPLFNNVKLQRILPQALPHPPHMHFHTFPRAQTSHSSSPTEGSFPPQLALGKSQTLQLTSILPPAPTQMWHQALLSAAVMSTQVSFRS